MTKTRPLSAHDRLEQSGDDGSAVLIGAHSLGVWMTRYDIATSTPSDFVAKDVDFLMRAATESSVVRRRSVTIATRETAYRVLHPLDLLESRLDNLGRASRREDIDLGSDQLVATIRIVQGFLKEAAREEPSTEKRPVTLRYVGFIEKLATADAGKKVAKRYGIHVADAIEPEAVPSKEFRTKRLPQLAKLMSPARRRELSLPA